MDAHEAVRNWIERYSAAWKGHDADAVSKLYTEDAVYRSHPFRDPLSGHAGVFEYSRWAFDSEADVDLWFGEPIAADDRASVEYWAVILWWRSESMYATAFTTCGHIFSSSALSPVCR